MHSLGHGRRTGVSGRGKSRPPRAYHRKVGEAMAANADRRLQLLGLASLAAVLAAAALATALVLDPPRLWWIGVAAVSLTVFALGAGATLAVPRLRVSTLVPAMVRDRAHRLLVVADAICSPSALVVDAICGQSLDDVAVHLVVPVRFSHLHLLTDNESRERRQAERSLSLATIEVRQVVIPAALSAESGAAYV
jgi:hypothetical protein